MAGDDIKINMDWGVRIAGMIIAALLVYQQHQTTNQLELLATSSNSDRNDALLTQEIAHLKERVNVMGQNIAQMTAQQQSFLTSSDRWTRGDHVEYEAREKEIEREKDARIDRRFARLEAVIETFKGGDK